MVNRDKYNKNNQNNENNKKNNQNNLKGVITMVNRDINNNNKKESRIINGAVNILKKPEFKSLSKNKAYKEYEAIAETARLARELAEDAYQKFNDAEIELEEAIENNHVLKIENNKITKKYDSALEDIKKSELLRESALEDVNKLTEDLNNSEDEKLELTNHINDLTEDLKNLNNMQHDFKTQLKVQQMEIDKRGVRIQELGNKIHDLNEEKNKLKKENENQAHRITGLEGNNRAYDKDIAKLESDLESKDKEIEKLQVDAKGFKNRLKKTTKKFKELEKENKKTIEEFNVINEDKQTLAKKIEEQDETIENLKIQVQEGRGVADASLQIFNELNSRLEENNQNVTNSTDKITGNNQGIEHYKQRKQETIREIKCLEKEIKNGNNVQSNKVTLQILKDDLSDIDKKLNKYNNIVTDESKIRSDYLKVVVNIKNDINEIETFRKIGGKYGLFSS